MDKRKARILHQKYFTWYTTTKNTMNNNNNIIIIIKGLTILITTTFVVKSFVKLTLRWACSYQAY